jgi:hypothetical protein
MAIGAFAAGAQGVPFNAEAQMPAPLTLSLICSGQATLHATTQTEDGHNRTRTVHSKEALFLQLGETTGRVRIPDAMAPGGLVKDDGWKPLIDLAVSETEISARIRMGSFFKPKIVIDRVHGVFDTEGLLPEGFSGACETDRQTKPKF